MHTHTHAYLTSLSSSQERASKRYSGSKSKRKMSHLGNIHILSTETRFMNAMVVR